MTTATASLVREDFAGFFAEVRGFPPFAWQERLLDHVVENGRWPEVISAPTGTGKTAVIDVHVFANALFAAGAGARVPRRLALVVNRRILVDSHLDHAKRLSEALAVAEDGAVAWVAEALRGLVPASPTTDGAAPALSTALLRGGVRPSDAWRTEPERCAVLTCTPDMWGSRLLLRGYGISRRARPQEAGLLALDSVAVIDEAHLSRQLVLTARRVADLLGRGRMPGSVPGLQVSETTATPQSAAPPSVGVEPGDLTASPVLARRLTAPKPLRLIPLSEWPAQHTGASMRAMTTTVADAVDDVLARTAEWSRQTRKPHTVGCVLNRVDDVLAVTDELRQRGRTVVALTGRLRPVDRWLITGRHPHLLDIEGNHDVDVLVATQTLEVGVDIDLAGLVTDLAPGTALVQRAGRVNRLGDRERAPVVVVVPERALDEEDARWRYTYDPADLNAARAWLDGIVNADADLAPWRLREITPTAPGERSRRDLLQRLSRDDLRILARTSDAGHADLDLTFWLADELEGDPFVNASIGVVLRHLRLPSSRGIASPDEVTALLRTTPPEDHETMALRRSVVQSLVGAYVAASRQRHTTAPVYRYRLGEPDQTLRVVSLPVVIDEPDRERGASTVRGLRSGDVVVLDADLVLAAGLAPWSTRVVGGSSSAAAGAGPFGDVYEQGPVSLDDPVDGRNADQRWRGQLHLRVGDLSSLTGQAAVAAIAAYRGDDLRGSEVTDDNEVTKRLRLADALDQLASDATTSAPWSGWVRSVSHRMRSDLDDVTTGLHEATGRFSRDPSTVDVVVSAQDEEVQYLVVRDDRRPLRGDRLSIGGAQRPVTLKDHQGAVADRVRQSAIALGLSGELAEALCLAGLHHDDGKDDRRFQLETLGVPADKLHQETLAKSGRESRRGVSRRIHSASLPTGWRHEQLSVLRAARSLRQPASVGEAPDVDLVLRLVGTSHGWGRPAFPHASVDLLPLDEINSGVIDLFDDGGWEDLVERTDARYGVWTVAYLEALLRAADARVSQEGS